MLDRFRTFGQGPILAVGLLVAFLGVTTPSFLDLNNFVNIFNQMTVWGLLALGMTFVILTGGIDLSVGTVMALSMMILGWASQTLGLPFELSILLAILAGALVGFLNGLMVAKAKLPPFIATLAMFYACRGVANIVTDGKQILGYPDWFTSLSFTRYFGFLNVTTVFFMALALVCWVYLSHLSGGRKIYAVGNNEEVCRLAGIRVPRVKLWAYTICGTFGGLAGVALASRMNSSYPQAASLGYELYAIAIVVVGGSSLSGGIGTIGGTLVGALFIGVLNNGLNLNDVNTHVQTIALGVVLVSAIVIDLLGRKKISKNGKGGGNSFRLFPLGRDAINTVSRRNK